MLKELAVCLALTEIVELAAAWAWGLRGRDLKLCALVNLLTNPAVVLLHNWVPGLPAAVVLEGAAAEIEWRYYKTCGRAIRRPGLFALCANGASVLAGLVLLGGR